MKGRYTVILFGRNVLNAVQYDYIYPGTSVPVQLTHALNAPATYGVQVQVRFK